MLDGIVALGDSSTEPANKHKRGVKKQNESVLETPVDEQTK